MKIILIGLNSKFIHNNLAIENLLAYNKGIPGAEFEILSFTINQSKEEILKGIATRNPDIAGFSAYIWNIGMILDIVTNLKKIRPGLRIVLGGPEVSYDPEFLLENHPEIDYVIAGEGESALGELTKNLLKGNTAPAIDGVYFRGEGGIQGRGMGVRVPLDEIPTIFDGKDAATHIVYYESSRGCPYNCSYCLSSTTRGLRGRSLDQVLEDLSRFIELGVPLVKFIDRTFNADHHRSRRILDFIVKTSRGRTTFHFEIAPNLLTPEWLAVLRSAPAGLFQVEIGIQSVHERVLRAVNRPMTFESIENKLQEICALENVHTHVDLIAGLPYSSLEDFLKSFDKVYALGADQFQLGFLKLLKGSRLRNEAPDMGYRYDDKPPYGILMNRWLSYEDLLVLTGMEALMEVYANSGHFTSSLAFVLDSYDRPSDFFIAFGDFCEERGYFKEPHQLIRRFEILHEFLSVSGFEELDRVKALMKFDFYKKQRQAPGDFFSREIPVDKGALHDFLHDEKRVARFLPQCLGMSPREILKALKIVSFDYNVFEKPYPRADITGFFDYKKQISGIIEIGGNHESHH